MEQGERKSEDGGRNQDGYRDYGFVPAPAGSTDIQYRIAGFRGAPPRINLRAFLDDALRHGLMPETEVLGVWFGNETWNGSLGATLVTRFDLIVDGKRQMSVPAKSVADR